MFLLPYEVLGELLKMQCTLAQTTQAHIAKVESHLSIPLLGLGLWCDGVPFNWDRSAGKKELERNANSIHSLRTLLH